MFAFEGGVLGLIYLAMLALKVWAVVDAIIRPAGAFAAAEKLTKNAWLLILGLSLAAAIIIPAVIGLLSLAGLVAAAVYLLDVRPALVSVTRR